MVRLRWRRWRRTAGNDLLSGGDHFRDYSRCVTLSYVTDPSVQAADPLPAEAPPILRIADLVVAVRGPSPQRTILSRVDLDLVRGRITGLLGPSGSGKTTLASALIGLLPPELGIVSGSIRLDGRELVGLDEAHWRRIRGARIAVVPQEPTLAFNPVLRIGSQLDEVLRVHGVGDRRARRATVMDRLAWAGIDDPDRIAASYSHQLSGGQLQRVVLARSLCGSPAVVVADESLAAVDAPLRVDLLDRLREIASSAGAAILMISHDPADLARIADQVAVLEAGRIVEQGAAHEVWRRPRSQTLVGLLGDLPRLPDASTDEPSRGEPAGPVLLRAEGVSRRYGRGMRSFEALKPLSLDIRGGETIAVVGPSGAGKSTLTRCLCLHDRPTEGRLRVLGQDPCATSGTRLRRLRREVQLVAQDAATAFNPRFSVFEAVMEPLLAFQPGTTTTRRDRVAALLDEVELSPALASQRVTHLSGGERQRVALARALAADPQVMVLDESLSSLDLHSRARLIALLRRLQRNRGLAYVVVSHDLATVVEIADEIVILTAGSAVERSSPRTLFRAPHHPQARRLVTAVQLLRRGLN